MKNINLILDTGLRRYDEEKMKFHTSKGDYFWIALTLHRVPGGRRDDEGLLLNLVVESLT